MSLQGETLSRSDSLAIPFDISVIGDKLAVIDLGMEHVLHVYDRSSGRHLRSGLGRGDGPGEVRLPWSLHIRDRRACVWDLRGSRSACIDTATAAQERATPGRELPISDSTLLRGGVSLIDVAIASDTLLIGLSYKDPGRFVLVDYRGGRALGSILPNLPPGSRDVPAEVLYNGDLKLRPGTDQFVFAPRYGGEIYVGVMSGGVRRIAGPVPFSAVETQLDIMKREDGSRRRVGYLRIDVTDRAVYGLFSGRFQGSTPEDIDRSMKSRELHIFSWATQRWRRVELDAQGVAIAVKEPFIYLLVREQIPEIRVYEFDGGPPSREEE